MPVHFAPLKLTRASLSFVKPAGKGQDIKIHGSATIATGGIDATCSFSIDRSATLIDQMVLLSDNGDLTVSSLNTTIDIALMFPRTRPSISMILKPVLGATGGSKIWDEVLKELLWIFDSVEFESVTCILLAQQISDMWAWPQQCNHQTPWELRILQRTSK